MNAKYIQLSPESKLPDISAYKPFLAVLVIEEHVTPGWREAVSQWLVGSGCKIMLSWGTELPAWTDAVDLANIAQFDNGEIPEDELVLAGEYEQISLEQFIKEAKFTATQDCADFTNTLIIHISEGSREQELLAIYSRA